MSRRPSVTGARRGPAPGPRRVALALLAVAWFSAPAAAQWTPKTSCDQFGGYELRDCLAKELTQADKALNDAYQKALAAIAADADTPADQKATWRANLVAAERAWLAYRDANCKFDLVGAEWNFGSGTTAAQQECVLALTQSRAAELLARMPSAN